MITEVLHVSIDGEQQDDVTPDIVRVDVDESVDEADVFRVQLAVAAQPDGSWSYVDDERFRLWRRLTVVGGYPDDPHVLVDGYITHAEIAFTTEDDAYLEVTGADGSVLMDLVAHERAWPNKADHEIAKEVFDAYGLSHDVHDTLVQHPEAVSTIVQSETDIRFLRRLAARNGFECRVQGGTGVFRGPNLSGPDQKLLAFGFDPEVNLAAVTVRADGTPVSAAEIRRVDPLKKRVDTRTITDVTGRRLGARTLHEVREKVSPDRALLLRRAPASSAEMDAWLRSAQQGAEGFLTVQGEIDSRAYGAVLRAGRTVTVKGVGDSFSGRYYVSRVNHAFTPDDYVQRFEAYRNAIGRTGDERFATAAGPVAVAMATGTGGAAGNRVLPGRQRSVLLGGG